MKVVDASVLAPAVVDDTATGGACRSALRGSVLLAPELIDIEIASVIRRLVRIGHLGEDRAEVALNRLRHAALQRSPHKHLLPRIWDLRDNLSAYDASYVALAELMGCSLVTADQALASAPGVKCEIELIA